MKKLSLLLITLLPMAASAQYTEIINSNLPGNSQSAYAVGARVLQFEGGLWYERSNHKKNRHFYELYRSELRCALWLL